MWPRRHLIVSWGIGAILALAIFYLGLGWLWSAAQRFGALSLESQVISALSGDLAEGNILRLGATFSKLQQDGHLHF